MPPDRSRDPRIDELIAALPPSLAEIAGLLCRQVRRSAPGLRETVKWRAPVWEGRSNAICIMIYPRSVNLGFFRGAELLERFPELEGTGKRMRHLKVPDRVAARQRRIGELLRAAAELDGAGPAPRRTPKRPG